MCPISSGSAEICKSRHQCGQVVCVHKAVAVDVRISGCETGNRFISDVLRKQNSVLDVYSAVSIGIAGQERIAACFSKRVEHIGFLVYGQTDADVPQEPPRMSSGRR